MQVQTAREKGKLKKKNESLVIDFNSYKDDGTTYLNDQRKNILFLLFVSVCQGCHDKVSQTEWLKQKKCMSHSSGGWWSGTKVLAKFVSSEASLLGTQMVISLCLQFPTVPVCDQVSSFLIKTSVIWDQDPP